ncbi:hypothetical protein QQS21_008669 [Conoideocrella luteorostrata]|uniref:Peptidase S8/S53 domain-containing protein n=1 Tax=Conoideocrella luteorostrata TaxID=1105319 RepID=A0AAJ0FQZ7_9HYPO|nr:hypothetical protein QQS21_008669 [Conoideocrella luteorostrata]
MDEPKAKLLVDLPKEPCELLELLQDIIGTLREHLIRRFQNGSLETLDRKHLNYRLWQLDFNLNGYMDHQQGPISQELYTLAHEVAIGFNSTIHASRIRDILEREIAPHYVHSPSPNGRESKIANLETFRTLVRKIPKDKQTIDIQRPLIKNMSVDGIKLLSSLVYRFNSLLCRENPQSEIAPTAAEYSQKRDRWGSEKDFRFYLSRCGGYEDLHSLLREYWPCPCGADHENKLGSCMNIMLCLQSGWTHPKLAKGEYDMILQHESAPLHCSIMIQTQSSPTPLAAIKLDHPCQALFDGIRGFKLQIVAAPITPAGFAAEFFSVDVASDEPGKRVSLQKILQDRVILRPRERRILAVILMYSFMQLLDGPWLKQYWDSADISFYQLDGNGGPALFNFRRPYLAAYWMAVQSSRRPAKLHQNYHPMPDMVTLARFLIELELQEYQVPPDFTQNLHSDLLKASKMLSRVEKLDQDEWAKQNFVVSMRACLAVGTYANYEPQAPHLGMWDIYQKVVSPLEQNLLAMLGPQATFKDLEQELSGVTPLADVIFDESTVKTLEQSPLMNTESDKWFTQLKQETHTLMRSLKCGEVKIAILDTGIDLQHPLLSERVPSKNCRDFVKNTGDMCDEVGHGTHTAYLLAKTAPQAEIFCGRVWKARREEDNTGKLIADAIKYAVDKWKVDIIVMPFAFPYRNEEIEEAIDNYHNKVLLFAAASNKTDEKLGFPACLPEVFCIYSNKTRTIQSRFCKLGKQGKYNFSTIGENVQGAWPTGLADREAVLRQTGTSCSTPIAAGVAALVLQFARQSGKGAVTRARKLKNKRVMENILFECMTEKQESGVYNLIEPWKLLSGLDGQEKLTLPSIANRISERITAIYPN